ncbi:MAG: hypothetical protein FDZ69_12050 [Deltaproteobacteria bacterium]|nr:MAG: hypothetical protein FDZ69_12050 [Deltaproteobacteria bacterium]
MEWIASLSTTGLFAFALWLLRGVIKTRLINAVRHEYEKDIEQLKTTLRMSEEVFKTDLKEKEKQIEALRSGALSAIMTRRNTLYARQLQAIEDIWGAVVSLSYGKSISATMAILKYEEAVKEAANSERFRKTFEWLSVNYDANQVYNQANRARPFVSELAWAYFSAYQTIIAHGVLRLKTLQIGVGKEFSDHDSILKIVKTALPEYSEFIAEHGVNSLHYLLDAIETKLLKEIQTMLKDTGSDAEDIKRAAQILEETEKLMSVNEQMLEA